MDLNAEQLNALIEYGVCGSERGPLHISDSYVHGVVLAMALRSLSSPSGDTREMVALRELVRLRKKQRRGTDEWQSAWQAAFRVIEARDTQTAEQ
jgi:hypothetical protein